MLGLHATLQHCMHTRRGTRASSKASLSLCRQATSRGRQAQPGADRSRGTFLDMVHNIPIVEVIVIVISILLLLYVIVIVVYIYNIVLSALYSDNKVVR